MKQKYELSVQWHEGTQINGNDIDFRVMARAEVDECNDVFDMAKQLQKFFNGIPGDMSIWIQQIAEEGEAKEVKERHTVIFDENGELKRYNAYDGDQI